LMWEFRRDPVKLTPEERQKLDRLFHKLPKLKKLYEIRVRFKEIFDTVSTRRKAAPRIVAVLLDAMDTFPKLESFLVTYENWREEILNYFDARQTSGGVEGINNKARVIIKRAYGLKSADSLWTRLILDLNRARQVVVNTIGRMHELVMGFRTIFAQVCT
jgi:transposase